MVCYLQRQLVGRDQRIAEQSYNIEQLKNVSIISDSNGNTNKKTASIQILRNNDSDLVISAVSQLTFLFLCALCVLSAIVCISCLVMSSFLYRAR
jgi:hypothetical protein